MGRIVISENITIDGVIRVSTGADASERDNWFARIDDRDREEWAKIQFEEALATEALLMGRRTYAWFVSRGWATRTDPWAERLRKLPKYVVSATALDGPGWRHSTVLRGDAVTEIGKLRQGTAGDLVVHGSGQLVRTLVEHDLVDEVRLMVFPFVAGTDGRLFGETSAIKAMRLVDTRTVGDGLTHLTYRPARTA